MHTEDLEVLFPTQRSEGRLHEHCGRRHSNRSGSKHSQTKLSQKQTTKSKRKQAKNKNDWSFKKHNLKTTIMEDGLEAS